MCSGRENIMNIVAIIIVSEKILHFWYWYYNFDNFYKYMWSEELQTVWQCVCASSGCTYVIDPKELIQTVDL